METGCSNIIKSLRILDRNGVRKCVPTIYIQPTLYILQLGTYSVLV